MKYELISRGTKNVFRCEDTKQLFKIDGLDIESAIKKHEFLKVFRNPSCENDCADVEYLCSTQVDSRDMLCGEGYYMAVYKCFDCSSYWINGIYCDSIMPDFDAYRKIKISWNKDEDVLVQLVRNMRGSINTSLLKHL